MLGVGPVATHLPDFLRYGDQLPSCGYPNSQLLPPPTQPVVEIPTGVRIKRISQFESNFCHLQLKETSRTHSQGSIQIFCFLLSRHMIGPHFHILFEVSMVMATALTNNTSADILRVGPRLATPFCLP